MYDIEVEEAHNFFANGLLAHNCHTSVTPKYAEKLPCYTKARRFGFSGSTDTRSDNMHAALEGMFGPTIFKMTYEEAKSLGLVTPVTVRWVTVTGPKIQKKGNNQHKWMQEAVYTNEDRNIAIAAEARHYVDLGKQVLIVVEKVEHLFHIYKYLPDFTPVFSQGSYLSDVYQRLESEGVIPKSQPAMTRELREEYKQDFEKGKIRGAICTGVWNKGVSFNNLDVVIRAEGIASKTMNVQVPGRVLRTGEKDKGLLVDIYDSWNSNLLRRSQTRRASYKEIGFEQLPPGKPRALKRPKKAA